MCAWRRRLYVLEAGKSVASTFGRMKRNMLLLAAATSELRISLLFRSVRANTASSIRCREDVTCPTRTSLRYLAAHEQECGRLRDELFDAQQELSEIDSVTETDAEEEVKRRVEEEVTKRVEEEIKKRSSSGGKGKQINKKRKKTKEAKLQAEVDRLQREVVELVVEKDRFKRK